MITDQVSAQYFCFVVRGSIAQPTFKRFCCRLCHNDREARADASEGQWPRETVLSKVASFHMVH